MRHFSWLGADAGFSDIEVGERVVVWLGAEDDNLLAKRVLIIDQPAHNRVIGTITDVSTLDKTVTIMPEGSGTKITLSYNDSTRIVLQGVISLAEGQNVRAVYDGDLLAKAICAR